tara:strand:- start:112 stop:672 length:561 start_codon:yes stop_codon:yes gene_type:complete
MPSEDGESASGDGAIYSRKSSGMFATEKIASDVGDLVTISLNESFQATKSQSASSGKDDSFAVTLPQGIFPSVNNADLSLGTTQKFDGTGSASQSNAITGLVSAAVIRRYPNGNLEIMGQKKLTLNHGDEYIRVRGIVRPQDIGVGNVVQSNRLANAEITYIGAGELSDTAKQGWLASIVRVVSPI